MESRTHKTISSPDGEPDPGTSKSEQEIFVMPVTPSQMRFWWLQHMRPGNRALNMPLAWTCRGALDQARAAEALSELIRRHESLRTSFEVVDGKLSQVIQPPFATPLPVEDLTALPRDEQQQKASAIIRSEARIQMDMEKGPLFFARLIRLGPDEHVFLVTIHHSVCDGWSNGVVLRDFAAIYDGLMRHAPPDLPELSIQFGDFAVWLDELRKGNEPEESLQYWREALGGEFTPLEIARDFPGGGAQEEGEIETLLLPSDLAQRARDFCAARGLTLYMLLLSVYGLTLGRLTHQDDFLIGTPCANRRAGTEDLIGPFSNPQVMRMRMDKSDNLGTVLERVRTWTLGALAHQDLPFEDLNEDDFFSSERNQIPLQVYFIYQKAFMQVQRTPSLEIVPLRSVSPGTMFDLMLSIVERNEGPRLQLEYNPGFFRASTMQRILRLYRQVLDATLQDTGRRVEQLPSIDDGEPHSAVVMSAGNGHSAAESDRRSGSSLLVEEVSASLGSREYVAPHNPLELQVARIWESVMGMKEISVQDSFFDLGGRSLAAMRIVSRINRAYSLDFGLATLFSGNTIERMAELIQNRLATNTSSSLVPMQPHGSAAPLFIIHGAGGNIIRFYQLAMLVGTDHPIYGVQAQSLLAGQPALLRLEDQAAYYLAEIRQIQPHGPYHFLGYSFGGTTALEIAHQLRAQGEQIGLLGMLDSRQRDYMVVMQRKDSVRSRFDRRMARFFGNIGRLSFLEKIDYLWDKFYTRTLRRIYTVAAALGIRSVPSFMKSTDDISWVAAMNYRPQPWPGSMTLFRASAQPDPRLPRDLGWSPLAQGGVEVYELPGDHDLVFQEPNIQVLAEQIRICLEKSDADEGSLNVPAHTTK